MRLQIAGGGAGRGSVEFRGPYLGTGAQFQLIPRSITIRAEGIGDHDTGAIVAINTGANVPRTTLTDATISIGSQMATAYLMPEPITQLDAGAPGNPPVLRTGAYNFHSLIGDDELDVQNCTENTVTIHASEIVIGNLRRPPGQQVKKRYDIGERDRHIQALAVATADSGSECYLQDFNMAGRLDQIRDPDNLRYGTSIQLSRQLRVDLAELRDDYDPDTDPVSYLLEGTDVEASLELALPVEVQAPPAIMADVETQREQIMAAAQTRLQSGGDTERVVKAVQRLEQGSLRTIVCGPLPTDPVTCVLCGRVVPNRGAYIWAAHIKKRSKAEPHEILDENIGAAMCKIAGCDSLFEEGDVIVDENGVIRANEKQSNENPTIRDAMAALDGRDCTNFNTDNAQYYSWHRERHTAP